MPSLNMDPPLHWRISDDLTLLIAFARPENQVEMVTREQMLEFGEEEELVHLALDQTRVEPGVRLGRVDFTGEGPVAWVLEGDSISVATHALWAWEFEPPTSEHGTLVAVPRSTCVWAHPIRDGSVRQALDYLLKVAYDMGHAGQWALSQNLYWVRHGSFERMEVELDEGRIGMLPTPEFAELLKELA